MNYWNTEVNIRVITLQTRLILDVIKCCWGGMRQKQELRKQYEGQHDHQHNTSTIRSRSSTRPRTPLAPPHLCGAGDGAGDWCSSWCVCYCWCCRWQCCWWCDCSYRAWLGWILIRQVEIVMMNLSVLKVAPQQHQHTHHHKHHHHQHEHYKCQNFNTWLVVLAGGCASDGAVPGTGGAKSNTEKHIIWLLHEGRWGGARAYIYIYIYI